MKATFTILAALGFTALSACSGGDTSPKKGSLYEHEFFDLAKAECPNWERGDAIQVLLEQDQCRIEYYETNMADVRVDEQGRAKDRLSNVKRQLRRNSRSTGTTAAQPRQEKAEPTELSLYALRNRSTKACASLSPKSNGDSKTPYNQCIVDYYQTNMSKVRSEEQEAAKRDLSLRQKTMAERIEWERKFGQ